MHQCLGHNVHSLTLVVHTKCTPWQISGNLLPMYFVNPSIILSFSLIGGSLQPCLPRPQPFRDFGGKVWLPEAVWSYKGLCVYKCLWVTRISRHFTSFSFDRLSLVTWTRSLTLTTTLYQRYYHSSSLPSSILSKTCLNLNKFFSLSFLIRLNIPTNVTDPLGLGFKVWLMLSSWCDTLLRALRHKT